MIGLARHTDPQTSHDAARSVDTSRLEAIVLEVFKAAEYGLTQDELADRMPAYPLNTITPRLAPLINKGYLKVIGKRPGRSGRNQRILIHADKDFLGNIYDDEQSLDYFNRFIAGDR